MNGPLAVLAHAVQVVSHMELVDMAVEQTNNQSENGIEKY